MHLIRIIPPTVYKRNLKALSDLTFLHMGGSTYIPFSSIYKIKYYKLRKKL